MNNRRDFLKQTGVVFTGCCLAPHAAMAQARTRRRVSVGGAPVRTIDVHAHVIVPEATALYGVTTAATDTSVMAQARFDRMDGWGTDMQSLSINAVWYHLDRDVVTKVIQVQNEALASMCAKYPDRMVALASVALQFPELAAQQLEEGVKKYNLRGAAIGGHVNGDELSSPKFDPFWRKAEELGCLIFMHPQGIPELDKRLAGRVG